MAPNIYVDPETDAAIRALAEQQDRTVAAVVKRAVNSALMREPGVPFTGEQASAEYQESARLLKAIQARRGGSE